MENNTATERLFKSVAIPTYVTDAIRTIVHGKTGSCTLNNKQPYGKLLKTSIRTIRYSAIGDIFPSAEFRPLL